MSQNADDASPQHLLFEGACLCGAASYRVEGKPLVNCCCHCTLCQRLNGAPSLQSIPSCKPEEINSPLGCAFTHVLHYPAAAFTWTHKDAEAVFTKEEPESAWASWRCKACYAFIAGSNASEDRWSVRSSHFRRNKEGLIENWELLKPRGHIFYGTRMIDVDDDVPKWEGYGNVSRRMDIGGKGEFTLE